MFTGIVEAVGEVVAVDPRGPGARSGRQEEAGDERGGQQPDLHAPPPGAGATAPTRAR